MLAGTLAALLQPSANMHACVSGTAIRDTLMAVLQQANVGRSICCSGLIMEHEWNCASCWITTERNNETVKHRNNSCGIRMPFFKQACVFLFVLTFLVCLSVQLWVSYSFPEHHFDWLQPPMNGQSIICLCLA